MPDAPAGRLRGLGKGLWRRRRRAAARPRRRAMAISAPSSGPSGCGKSTLLRMIAGFVEPTGGPHRDRRRRRDGARPGAAPHQHGVPGLWPVPASERRRECRLRPRAAGRCRGRRSRRAVAEALRLVRLEGFGDRAIDRLSGGQQQRVALARALIMRPKVLLLDEPLAALDLKLRHAMQEELRRIHREIGGTFIFVTHDQTEAFALASRIVVMNEGRIEQVGAPAGDLSRARIRCSSPTSWARPTCSPATRTNGVGAPCRRRRLSPRPAPEGRCASSSGRRPSARAPAKATVQARASPMSCSSATR